MSNGWVTGTHPGGSQLLCLTDKNYICEDSRCLISMQLSYAAPGKRSSQRVLPITLILSLLSSEQSVDLLWQ